VQPYVFLAGSSEFQDTASSRKGLTTAVHGSNGQGGVWHAARSSSSFSFQPGVSGREDPVRIRSLVTQAHGARAGEHDPTPFGNRDRAFDFLVGQRGHGGQIGAVANDVDRLGGWC